MHDHNIVISAILVLINTFGGHFLVFGLYPLLVMTPAALFTIYPSLVPQRISKIIIKNNNGTKQREIVKKIFDNPKSGTSDVTAQKHIDDNDDLDISHGELTLYENDDLFIGCLFKTGCQLIILQGVRVRTKICSSESMSRNYNSIYSFSDILCNACVYNSVSAFDGVENICTAIHLRGNCYVYHIWRYTNWLSNCYSGSQRR